MSSSRKEWQELREMVDGMYTTVVILVLILVVLCIMQTTAITWRFIVVHLTSAEHARMQNRIRKASSRRRSTKRKHSKGKSKSGSRAKASRKNTKKHKRSKSEPSKHSTLKLSLTHEDDNKDFAGDNSTSFKRGMAVKIDIEGGGMPRAPERKAGAAMGDDWFKWPREKSTSSKSLSTSQNPAANADDDEIMLSTSTKSTSGTSTLSKSQKSSRTSTTSATTSSITPVGASSDNETKDIPVAARDSLMIVASGEPLDPAEIGSNTNLLKEEKKRKQKIMGESGNSVAGDKPLSGGTASSGRSSSLGSDIELINQNDILSDSLHTARDISLIIEPPANAKGVSSTSQTIQTTATQNTAQQIGTAKERMTETANAISSNKPASTQAESSNKAAVALTDNTQGSGV